MLKRDLIYVQVHKGFFIARKAHAAETIKRNCEGLNHPRTLAGDYKAIEGALRFIFKDFWTLKMWFLKPDALVHLIPKVDGGHTAIELRAFREAAEACGVRRAWMLTGEEYGPLSDGQLREICDAL